MNVHTPARSGEQYVGPGLHCPEKQDKLRVQPVEKPAAKKAERQRERQNAIARKPHREQIPKGRRVRYEDEIDARITAMQLVEKFARSLDRPTISRHDDDGAAPPLRRTAHFGAKHLEPAEQGK